MWLAGARVRSAVPIAPTGPLVPLAIAALSSAGELTLSVNADAAAHGIDELAAAIGRGLSRPAERALPVASPA